MYEIVPMDRRTLYTTSELAANAAGLAMQQHPSEAFRWRVEDTGAAWVVQVMKGDKPYGWLFDGVFLRDAPPPVVIPSHVAHEYVRAKRLLDYTPPGWPEGTFRKFHERKIAELEERWPTIRAAYEEWLTASS